MLGAYEATSALDSISEEEVQLTIEKLKNKGVTVVIIAHRLSTVMNSDKIVVLENGKLQEEGTHEQLILKNGKYKTLWNKQFPNVFLT